MSGPNGLWGPNLEWKQSGAFSRTFELLEQGRRRGSLSFTKAFGTLAEGEIDGSWYTFKRVGFLRPQVTIWRKPYEEDIGRVSMGLGSRGSLELSDGARYNFQRQSLWKNVWGFSNEHGDALMTIRMDLALLHHNGQVVIEPSGREDPHMPLLVLLGWYMAVLIEEENAAAAGAAAGATGGA